MPDLHPVPAIHPEDFKHFQALFLADSEFPRTYGAWLARSHPLPGRPPRGTVLVEFHEFSAYCRRETAEPSLAALTAFASVKALHGHA